MQFVDQLLNFLRQGIAAVFKFIHDIWGWSIRQIEGVPWEHVQNLPLWKILLLVAAAGGIIYLAYKSVKELIEAGQKALGAFATLLSVFIQTLFPILLAGLVAAGAAYVVNNVNF